MRNVHLVGSVPLENAQAVFAALGSHLGRRLKRYPDGETGARTNWTRWQVHVFEGNPSFTVFDQSVPSVRAGIALGLVRPPEEFVTPLYLREADAVANFTTRERPQ